jgi:hypothetical protein
LPAQQSGINSASKSQAKKAGELAEDSGEGGSDASAMRVFVVSFKSSNGDCTAIPVFHF